MNTAPETIDASTVKWEFERMSWSRGPAGITARIALALNTLDVLEQAASAQTDNLFYWSMSGRLRTKTVISEHSGDELRVATEAGYFLPVSKGVAYGAFTEFFDLADKHGHLLSDDRIIVAALREVLNTARDMAVNCNNESDWEKQRSEYSELLADSNYELATQNETTDAIAQKFNYLSKFEDKRNASPVTSTHEEAMRLMLEFFSSLTYKHVFDSPSADKINTVRERHQEWCQQFDRSNIRLVTTPWIKSEDSPYAGIGAPPKSRRLHSF